MNGALFGRTVAANRIRLVACGLGLLVWGSLLPVIYATFGKQLAEIMSRNPLFEQFGRFGGGDLLSLAGAMALGLVHPFTLLLMGVMAVGFPAIAIAGERQRGTLEVLLARPISRRTVYTTLYVAGLVFVGLLLALELGANVGSALVMGVGDELQLEHVPALWLQATALFGAFLSVAFAASVSFDRLPPALGVGLVFMLLNYLADVIGSLWPDAAWLGDWTLFQLVPAQRILSQGVQVSELIILLAVSVVAVTYALIAFPRRDLAAPS